MSESMGCAVVHAPVLGHLPPSRTTASRAADDAVTADVVRRLDPGRLGDHLDRLYAAAWSLCGDRAWAEDLVQETFARVLARPRFLRNDDDLGYLLRALRNTFYVELRKHKREPRGDEITAESEPPDRRRFMQPERETEANAVFDALARLPDDFRVAIVAIDVMGLSYKETARALGIPEGTVRSRLYRARDRAADLLSDRTEPTGRTSTGDDPHARR